MKNEHISNIKKRDLLLRPGKYLWLPISEEYSNVNFSLLLDFIDKYSDYGRDSKYGNAYYRIRKETNRLFGVGIGSPMKLKTSKWEIKSIRSSKISNRDGQNYIRIPYKVSYIFKAIINIVNQIKIENNIELPLELKETINLSYGIAFYQKHINIYDSYYDDLRENSINNIGYGLKVELNNDFHAEDSVFDVIVK